MKLKRRRIWVLPAAILWGILLCAAAQMIYTIHALQWARRIGIYNTPQEAVIANINRHYCEIERIDIEQAATNSFDGSNPHVWYVIWRVYARSHTPCDPENPGTPLYHQTHEGGGNFYLNVRDGWVLMPEGRLPQLIGFWMKVLGLAGPGDPTHVPRN